MRYEGWEVIRHTSLVISHGQRVARFAPTAEARRAATTAQPSFPRRRRPRHHDCEARVAKPTPNRHSRRGGNPSWAVIFRSPGRFSSYDPFILFSVLWLERAPRLSRGGGNPSRVELVPRIFFLKFFGLIQRTKDQDWTHRA